MTKALFTLADCPTPYPPFMAGALLPQISLTLPLESGEDLTGASVRMILVRDTSDPDNPDVLEKVLVEDANVAGQHWKGHVAWVAGDLIEGAGQQATFILTLSGGEEEPISRFNIDVFANPDLTP